MQPKEIARPLNQFESLPQESRISFFKRKKERNSKEQKTPSCDRNGRKEEEKENKKFREGERITGENCFVFAGGIHIQQARYLTPSKEEGRGEERRH